MKRTVSVFVIVLMLSFIFSGCGGSQPKQIEVDGMVFIEASKQDISVTDENFFVCGKCVDVTHESVLNFSTYTWIIETKIGTFDASLTITPSSYENIDTELAESFKGKEITILGRFSDIISKTTGEQSFLCSHYQTDESGNPLRFTAENVLGATESQFASEPADQEQEYVFSAYFQKLLEDRAEVPDYSVYNDYAKNNGKEYTYIVMHGTFDKVYDLNGYLHIEFLENNENRYALCAGFSDEKTKEELETLSGKEAEVLACYTGFSDISKVPCAILYEYYYDGEICADIWAKVVSEGFSDFGKPSGGKELEDFFPEAESSSTIESSSTETSVSTSTSELDDSESSVIETPTHSGSVWIPTNGGTKYHTNSSCSNMENPQKVSEDEAIAMGFEPCKRCH